MPRKASWWASAVLLWTACWTNGSTAFSWMEQLMPTMLRMNLLSPWAFAKTTQLEWWCVLLGISALKYPPSSNPVLYKYIKCCYHSVNGYYVLELAVFALCLQLPKTFLKWPNNFSQWPTKFVACLTLSDQRKFVLWSTLIPTYVHTTSVLSYVLKIDQDCHTYSQCHQVQIALCTTLELQ